MNKIIIFVIVIAIIALVSFSIIKLTGNKAPAEDAANLSENNSGSGNAGSNANEEHAINFSKNNSVSRNAGNNTNAGESSGQAGEGGGEDNASQEVPRPDIENTACGFYFESYGVCAGTCPSGACTSEGRSCYCK